MPIRRQIALSFLILLGILAVFDLSTLDVWLQNHFYDAAAAQKPPMERWVIFKDDRVLDFWFHKSIRRLVTAFGIMAFLTALAGFWLERLAPYRRRLLFLSISMAMVSVLVGGAKYFTNTYCPNQTVLYGGDKPYVKVLQHYPDRFEAPKKGRCFPAGHATAGFGLMALYFVFTQRRTRIAGLIFGLSLGWGLGIFQMLRGEHFLSHTLVSMVASWLVILITRVIFTEGMELRVFTSK